jgi:hypothetical protein
VVTCTLCSLPLLLLSRASTPILQAPDYSGSCGRCYEIACRPDKNLRDGNGKQMDRSYSCKEGVKVTVTITDTCPCYYPSNQYSNQRW